MSSEPSGAFTSETNRVADASTGEQPLFSIVPACYAVRRYLPDFLASLDAQDFDKSRCELVFVVDGCPEDSGAVIREWMPTTDYAVRLVEKENGGVASARNLGFSLARGSWIMSPDPDDTLDPAYLSHLAAAAEEFPSETMFVSRMRSVAADGAPLSHPFDFRFHQKGAHVVDLQRTPEQIHLSGGTALWSSEVMKRTGLRFDERLRTGSDADFNLRYLIENGARYVIAPDAIYHYLKRGDGTSIIDRATKSYARYEATIGGSHAEILDRAGERCPQWLANSLLYAVFHLFRGCRRPNSPAYSLSSAQRRSISAALRKNLSRIGAENIRAFDVVDLPFEIRYAWLAAVAPLASSPVVLRETNAVTRHRRVGVFASTRQHLFTASTSERPSATWSRKIRAVEFLGETWCYEHLIRVDAAPGERVRLRSRPGQLEFEFDGQALTEKRLLERMGTAAPALPELTQPEPARHDNGKADSGSIVERQDRSDVAEPRNAWVIDLPTAGSRNALPLYDHLRASRPHLPLRLVADAELVEGLRMAPTGSRDVVPRGTARHRQLMETAALLVSSDLEWAAHNRFDAPGPKKTWRFLHLPEQVHAWPDYRRLNRSHIEAIAAASPFEVGRLSGPETPYSIDGTDVWTVGLPYQDRLHEAAGPAGDQPPLLLIAPSPRRDWGAPGMPGLAEHLASTEFAQRWRSLLADPRLEMMRERHGMRARFIAPTGYEPLLPLLDPPSWIEVCESSDWEGALAGATVCLTDYSDIAFDAARCGSAAVYFQFDRTAAERESLLTLPGAFDFADQGFGPVVEHEDGVFEALEPLLSGASELPSEYRRRIDSFFYALPAGSASEQVARALEAWSPAALDHPPRISLVVNCGDDPGLLETTLTSIDDAGAGLCDILLLVDTDADSAAVGELAEKFAESHGGSVAILPLAASQGLSESELRERLSGDWTCLVEAGVSLTPRLHRSLSELLAARPELQIAAAYPIYAGKCPFPSKYDIVSRGVDLAPRAIVDLEDLPMAFSAMSLCGLMRTDLLRRTGGDTASFLHLGMWAAIYRGALQSGGRLGLLNGAVEASPGARARIWLPSGSQEGTKRFLLDSVGALESMSGTRSGPVASSVIVFLAVRALRRFSTRLWESDEEMDDFRSRLAGVLDALPPRDLVTSHWAQGSAPKYALCSIGGLRPHVWEASHDRQNHRLLFQGHDAVALAKLEVTLMRAQVVPGDVEIEAYFMGYRASGFDLVLSGPDGRVLRAVERSDHWQGVAERFGSFVTSPASYRRFRIPLSSRGAADWQLGFLNENSGQVKPCLTVRHGSRSPFQEARDSTRLFNDHGVVSLHTANTLRVSSAPPNRWLYNYTTARSLRRDGIDASARRFSSNRKDVLLITDRPKFGDDNGEALFRYIRKNRKDLREHTWLVLDRSAPSYAELKSTGRIVEPGTPLHRKLYLNARIVFASHLPEAYNNPFFGEEPAGYVDEIDFTFVWLQHGITMNSVGGVFSRLRRGHDGVVVGGRRELEFASDPDLALSDHRVLDAGFPRFDLLEDRREGVPATLLYMPTWRTWLTGERQADGTSLAKENLAEEDYYAHQRAFLTSRALGEALERADARIEMMLHPAISAYQDLYLGLASERVIVHSPGQVKYRDLFARGSAMVTDYSSVFFDFAYLAKPVIFDHSDLERFRAQHYREGLFSYERDAPGPIGYSLDEMLDQTISLIDRGFALDPDYERRLDDLYLHRDRSNSQRVLDQALEIDRRRRAGLLGGQGSA